MRRVPETLPDLLQRRAEALPDAPAFTFLRDGEDDAVTWTFSELARRAHGVAAALHGRVAPGARVFLLHPQGLDYVAALLGCACARVLAVPLQPPGGHRADQAVARLVSVAAGGDVGLILTTSSLLPRLREALAGTPLADVELLATDLLPPREAPALPPVAPDDVAWLQYTSGSTAAPRGVVVTHRSLLENLRTFDADYAHGPDAVMVSWLPGFHDLGLVYGLLMPLYGGFRCVLLDPVDFLRRPSRWVRAVHTWRGTHSPAPCFAFELVAARTPPEERAGLDLSCWRVALDGAEPIRHESEARFVEAFEACGVSWRTVSHAYGMSETTAVISKEPAGTEAVFLDLDAHALERHRVVPVPVGTPGARRVAGCGVAVAPTVVRVVDPERRVACAPDQVGELWVGGPSVGAGYWQQPDATDEAFGARLADTGEGPFLRTGDLGFVHQEQVFVTGRRKDLIIVRGENHYPQDLEGSVQGAHPAIRPGGVAAFALPGEGATERVAVVAEVAAPPEPSAPVVAAVREALAGHGLHAALIALVPPRAVHKTGSGKVMRRATRQALLDGSLPVWVREEAAPPASGPVDAPDLGSAADRQDRHDRLVAHVLARAAALLGVTPTALRADAPLRDLGLDSVQVVELVEHLGADLGRRLPTSLVFDHPTAEAIAGHLLDRADDAPAEGPPAPPRPLPADVPEDATEDELLALLRDELDDLEG